MLARLISDAPAGEVILAWIEWASLIIEVVAVVIIVAAIINALARYMLHILVRSKNGDPYEQLKVSLGKALLLGLEILVAADVIRTVALEATLNSVMVLGILVLIRTFLSWALVVEMEGRWPWQSPSPES
ncbi:MAG TPA: DUF1622 domain-containing protein [Anaerolineae bacterium]|nr:DUF1622 domain-containing protein [Anaerolineae bacterium]